MKFRITEEVKERVREIVPEETDTIEIKRTSENGIFVYAIYKGIRIAEARKHVEVGESFLINQTKCIIDWEDES